MRQAETAAKRTVPDVFQNTMGKAPDVRLQKGAQIPTIEAPSGQVTQEAIPMKHKTVDVRFNTPAGDNTVRLSITVPSTPSSLWVWPSTGHSANSELLDTGGLTRSSPRPPHPPPPAHLHSPQCREGEEQTQCQTQEEGCKGARWVLEHDQQTLWGV